jgi:tryptophan 2,3-dioxygenase
MNSPGNLTYGKYLRLDDLLSCQSPLTDAQDEMLFVIIHQVYELWFKQILHETGLLQHRLEAGESAGALATAYRIAKILKTVVGQMDVLETMTPRQFARFRPELGSSSGFQSYQFRRIEAAFGHRHFSETGGDPVLAEIMERRPVFDSFLRYLSVCGWQVPAEVLSRDPREPWQGNDRVLAVLAEVYDDAGAPADVCEALVDIDEGIQEWRYRHVKVVERIIGVRVGTGGSSGVEYLRSTLFRPTFPDLWEIRSRPELRASTLLLVFRRGTYRSVKELVARIGQCVPKILSAAVTPDYRLVGPGVLDEDALVFRDRTQGHAEDGSATFLTGVLAAARRPGRRQCRDPLNGALGRGAGVTCWRRLREWRRAGCGIGCIGTISGCPIRAPPAAAR